MDALGLLGCFIRRIHELREYAEAKRSPKNITLPLHLYASAVLRLTAVLRFVLDNSRPVQWNHYHRLSLALILSSFHGFFP